MKKHYIDIDGYWGVLFIYDYDMFDMDEIAAILDSFGVSERKIREAMPILYSTNTGMTVSRMDVTMSAIFVSRASSVEQFMDTVAHEVDHVQDAIDAYYGVRQGSEDSAWLQGYIMRGIAKALKEDGVVCPNRKQND